MPTTTTSNTLNFTNAAEMARGLPPVQRLRALFRRDRPDIWAVVVFSALNGILLLATPVAVQSFVNNVSFGAAFPSIVILAILLFVGLAMAAVVLAIQTWIVEILQRRVFVRLVADLSQRLPRLSWRVRDQYNSTDLVNRFFDVVTIQKSTSFLLLEGLGNALFVIVGLMVIAFYHPLLFAFGIALLVLALLIIFLPMRRGIRTAISESNAKYNVVSWLEEITRLPTTLRTAGSERLCEDRSRAVAEGYVEARRAHYRVVFTQVISVLTVQVVGSTGILALGGWLVLEGQLTLGQLIAAELIVVTVVQSIAKLGKHAETFYDLVAAVDKVGKLIDLETEDPLDIDVPLSPADTPPELELRNIRIDSVKSGPLASGFSTQIAPGSIVGLSGPHGLGKTSLLEAIFKLREAAAGTILYRGLNYNDISLSYLRAEVALVSQHEVVDGSILDNIALRRPDVTVEDVHEALGKVGLLEKVRDLPNGLHTSVAPNQAPLSLGQWRQLAIARALVGKPRLLLVDHVLDGLSKPIRNQIIAALHDGSSQWTVLLISDNPEVLQQCDQTLDLRPSEAEHNRESTDELA